MCGCSRLGGALFYTLRLSCEVQNSMLMGCAVCWGEIYGVWAKKCVFWRRASVKGWQHTVTHSTTHTIHSYRSLGYDVRMSRHQKRVERSPRGPTSSPNGSLPKVNKTRKDRSVEPRRESARTRLNSFSPLATSPAPRTRQTRHVH